MMGQERTAFYEQVRANHSATSVPLNKEDAGIYYEEAVKMFKKTAEMLGIEPDGEVQMSHRNREPWEDQAMLNPESRQRKMLCTAKFGDDVYESEWHVE